MRSRASHRVFAIVLVLARLLMGELLHLPAAQATGHEPAAAPVMVMGAAPCPGMTGAPSGHVLPADGACCKSSQCPCLHAPTLMIVLQMPALFGISYPDAPATRDHRISEPPSVFFRPPIRILR